MNNINILGGFCARKIWILLKLCGESGLKFLSRRSNDKRAIDPKRVWHIKFKFYYHFVRLTLTLSLHGAGREARDDLALEDEDEHHERHRDDDGGRHDGPPRDLELGGARDQR